MKYALLDWDNTIRDGYTLFALVDYLVNRNIISGTIKSEFDLYIEKYKSNSISHDMLAKRACETFAKSLKNQKKSTIESAIEEYMEIDRNALFDFSSTIFEALNQNEVAPIIVSGAPSSIIRRYSEFNIYRIYGFSLKEINGIFTGDVSNNFGYNKRNEVKRIIHQMGCLPAIAFGDSWSDYAMLSIAKKSIAICKEKSQIPFKTDGVIFTDSNKIYVKKLINEMLSGSKSDSIIGFVEG